jgi:hypothetical protein
MSMEGEEEGRDRGATIATGRHALAGLWAAELLGLIGHAAQDYARELARAEGEAGDEPVIQQLARDLHGRVTVHEIRETLTLLLSEAKRQLRKAGPPKH